MAASKRVAVILAGGSGTRFWPLSRNQCPKQYLKLFGKRSLIQHTFDRLTKLCKAKDIFVCTSAAQKKQLARQLPKTKAFLEPAACNTGPAVLLTVLELLKAGYDSDTVLAIFPADHYITDVAAFTRTLNDAYEVAAQTHGLVTLGIRPRSPHTGYGYIEGGKNTGKSLAVTRFVEKPDLERAKEFVKSGRFFWNGGIFVWTLGAILEAYRTLAPSDFELLGKAKSKAALAAAYRKVNKLPVDKMILEKAHNVYMVPAEMGWSDVGSWNALYDLKPADSNRNVLEAGKAFVHNASGCFVHAPGVTVATIGVSNLIVVLEGDTLLICSQSADQDVREAARALDV